MEISKKAFVFICVVVAGVAFFVGRTWRVSPVIVSRGVFTNLLERDKLLRGVFFNDKSSWPMWSGKIYRDGYELSGYVSARTFDKCVEKAYKKYQEKMREVCK